MDQCINLGCGITPTKGYINFDNSLAVRLARLPEPMIDGLRTFKLINQRNYEFIQFCKSSNIRFCNAVKRIPLPDSSVDLVYSSHMIEHLDRNEVQSLLGEIWRVLNRNGILRLAIPGLRQKVDQYKSEGDADAFIKSLHTCVEKPKSISSRLRYAFIGPRHHHWMYDEASICDLIRKFGFRAPIICAPGETTIEHPDNLNLSERVEESIYVEARKD